MTGRPLDLTLYLVTDTVLCGEVGVARTAAQAVAARASVVQLRDPACTDGEFVRLGGELREALEGTSVPLIVNDRVHLVDEIGAAGAHVGQEDLDPRAAREQLGSDAFLGLSVQDVDHVEAALRLPWETVDYLGVGPVWTQATKPNAAPASGLETLTRIVRASPWPCVAIGGIDASRVPAVRRSGAAGVAVVSAVCGRPDPAAATRELLTAWEEHTP